MHTLEGLHKIPYTVVKISFACKTMLIQLLHKFPSLLMYISPYRVENIKGKLFI